MAETKDLNKLISLTFDENPAVRMKAAELLGKYDDPAAVFALMELNYDKDQMVRKKAQGIISSKKESGGIELLSFAELFSKNAATSEQEKEMPLDKKEKILSPISKMFEKHLGREKAELVKKRMMPTIEKIYHRSTTSKKPEEAEEHGRKVIQEFLTSYLDALSDLDELKHETAAPQQKVVQEMEEVPLGKAETEAKMGELEVLGKEVATSKLEEDLQRIENDELMEISEEEEIKKLPDTFFKKAYEMMMLSGGDQEIMQREAERMLKNAERDIKIAFKLARRKFREKKITDLTKIRDGMKNINTDILDVKEAETFEYEKSKRKKEKGLATRMVVQDANGNEGVIFLYDGRGTAVRPGMKLKVIKGQAKLFESSGETIITIGKRGEVYIVL